jgi:hypothetical protein
MESKSMPLPPEDKNPVAHDTTFAALVAVSLGLEGNLPSAFNSLVRAGKIANAYLTDGSERDEVLWSRLRGLDSLKQD